MALERWTTPTLSRRTCSRWYGLQSCERDWAGVVKRPREPISLLVRFATFCIAVRWWESGVLLQTQQLSTEIQRLGFEAAAAAEAGGHQPNR
jgi:hypothetical protein